MLEGLEYLIWRIEAQYYEQNKEVLSRECLKKEKLDCNCITGLIINYAGYLLKQYIRDPKHDVKFAADDDSFYLKAVYDRKELFPIKVQSQLNSFLYGDKVCGELEESEQARIPFGKYEDETALDLVKRKFEKYAQTNSWVLTMPEGYRAEFWVRFLEAMRMVDIKKGEKAFLTMAIFMFPGNTLRIVKKEVEKGGFSQDEINNLVHFLHNYIKFLEEIRTDEQFGFFVRFSKAFEKAVDIDVSELIEDIIKKIPEHIICQSFTSAYRNNKEEVSSNTRQLSKLLNLVKEQELSEIATGQLREIQEVISML